MPAARAHDSTYIAAAPSFELKRANGHVENRFARREEADGARIHTARRIFEVGQQLHGPHLGSARHEPEGKSARKIQSTTRSDRNSALTVEVICQSVA